MATGSQAVSHQSPWTQQVHPQTPHLSNSTIEDLILTCLMGSPPQAMQIGTTRSFTITVMVICLSHTYTYAYIIYLYVCYIQLFYISNESGLCIYCFAPSYAHVYN